MESKALLLVLLVGLFYSAFGQNSGSSEENNSGSNEENNENNNEADFVYPCGNDAEWNCIRDYFLNNSPQARPPRTVQEGQPIIRLRQPVHVSIANITVITNRGEIRFGTVGCEAFYMNTRSGNIVISLYYESINIFAEDTEYIINRRSLEPLHVVDFVNATYKSVVLTAVIPANPGIQMNRAAASAYILDARPQFTFGPRFSDSSDELVARTHNAVVANLATVVQEVYLTDALSYFLTYFETYVVDFGIPFSTPLILC